MSKVPKLDASGMKAFPSPQPADYSDEFSDEQWAAICSLTEEYQEDGGEVVSGEPW